MMRAPLAASQARSASRAGSSGQLRKLRALAGSCTSRAARGCAAPAGPPPAAAISARRCSALKPGTRANSARARSASMRASIKERQSGVTHHVGDVNGVGGADDQPEAHAIEHLEYEHRPGALVRQSHLGSERGSEAVAIADRLAAAVQVAHHIPRLVDGEHVAGLESVALAAVDDHYCELPGKIGAADHVDDAAVHVARRRTQGEGDWRL